MKLKVNLNKEEIVSLAIYARGAKKKIEFSIDKKVDIFLEKLLNFVGPGDINKIKEIEFSNASKSFTSKRTITAIINALSFALEAKLLPNPKDSELVRVGEISIAKPIYNKKPNITAPKRKTVD